MEFEPDDLAPRTARAFADTAVGPSSLAPASWSAAPRYVQVCSSRTVLSDSARL